MRGRPTINQLLLFAAFWLLPMELRQRLRAAVQFFTSARRMSMGEPVGEPHADPK